ncbi:hypothetical protein DKG77_08230 [Flagellimonas aquimarina]|uniref:Periplasmic heavy metal sensor n=2 Tax=Flagellimonas aquimarina TaxID=2201895 RepID=A0A316KX74_9FLAO|nr:hypothetical protein DKG77_08230 [Allomuricauda koreensis]
MKATLFYFFLFANLYGMAQQDCILGIGGQDDEMISEVFQLNDEQMEKMRNWSAELRIRNEILKNQAEFLLKKHAQSSPEDLVAMSQKYKDILDSMKQNVLRQDKRLLSIFNEKQYNFYLELCSQLTLQPIYVSRSVDEK